MKKGIFFFISLCISISLFSQSINVKIIIDSLNAINKKVVYTNTNNQMIITTAGINHLFANKIASYLSEGGDLSLYKQYATISSTDGKFSLNANLKPKLDSFGKVVHFATLGLRTNAANGFGTLFNGKKFSNEIGLTFKYTWIGLGKIKFDTSSQQQPKGGHPMLASLTTQKTKMNLERFVILKNLEKELHQKSDDFENYINNYSVLFDSTNPPPHVNNGWLDTVKNKFYSDLLDEYTDAFATQEVQKLESTGSYNSSSDYWFSFSAYIPITKQEYLVSPIITSTFGNQSHYPWEVNFSANRVTESRSFGKVFYNATLGMMMNNNVKTNELNAITLSDYKNLGGTDTLHLASLNSDPAYVGSYQNFITPYIRLQLVYFPKKCNIGASCQIEKQWGIYDPLNLKIGVPIRLNDKDGKATVNFEIQYKVQDIANNVTSGKSWGQKSVIGLSIGLPFNSLIY